MWHAIAILLLMFAGGVATSFAEHKFDYNLYELLKEKIGGLFGKKG